ncbi:hypothetical protein V5O48_019010, partial [Marasmius crinis-equi]
MDGRGGRVITMPDLQDRQNAMKSVLTQLEFQIRSWTAARSQMPDQVFAAKMRSFASDLQQRRDGLTRITGLITEMTNNGTTYMTLPVSQPPGGPAVLGGQPWMGQTIPNNSLQPPSGPTGIPGGPNNRPSQSQPDGQPSYAESSRANLFAVYGALKQVSLSKPLIIVTSSEYAVSALTQYIGSHMKTHWNGANGDILKAIVHLVRSRSATLHITFDKRNTTHSEEAETQAVIAGGHNITLQVPLVPQVVPIEETDPAGRCRMTTNWDINPWPEAARIPSREAGGLPSHRNRSKVLRRQDRNLAEFREAAFAPKKFWDTFRKFAGSAKVDTNMITADDLMQAFHPRMNRDPIIPDSFDSRVYELNEASNRAIPGETEDKTPTKIFEKFFEVEEIDYAKEELRRLHPGRTAAGGDDVHYADIRAMDSTLICV